MQLIEAQKELENEFVEPRKCFVGLGILIKSNECDSLINVVILLVIMYLFYVMLEMDNKYVGQQRNTKCIYSIGT